MTIQFKNVPSTLRVPLFFAELDPSRANTSPRAQRALLIGQKTAAGTLVPNTPVISPSESDAIAAAGPGSVLAGMVRAYRQNDAVGECWLLPLSDDAGATAASAEYLINSTGGLRTAGTISFYIAGRLVAVPIASTQVASAVVNTIVAAVNAVPDLPVVASAAGAVPGSSLTFTAKNKGLIGNDIDIRLNMRGPTSNEVLPAEITINTVRAMSGGTINPALTTALTNLQDTAFDFIVCSLTDAASIAAIAALLGDANGRWSWGSQVYGHCFMAYRGTAGAAAAFATGLNNQHMTVVPFIDSPTPSWKWAAAFAGAAAASLRNDPGQPLQYLSVAGIMAPPISSRWSLAIRNATLLYGGCSTFTVDATGTVVIENIITTYVTNLQGVTDNSYLQIETMYLLMYVLRRLQDVVTAKYSRVKLAADGVRLLPNSNVVTPSVIRADIIAAYRQLEAEGMVQQSAAFAAGLIVEKNATNPNRVDVQFPAVLVDQLRTFATLVQFRNS